MDVAIAGTVFRSLSRLCVCSFQCIWIYALSNVVCLSRLVKLCAYKQIVYDVGPSVYLDLCSL